jgi:hypothetical protein
VESEFEPEVDIVAAKGNLTVKAHGTLADLAAPYGQRAAALLGLRVAFLNLMSSILII